MSRPLPAPPASLVQQGQASHGRYAGLMDRFDWADLPVRHGKGRVWQWLHHKRWQYVGLATEQVFIGLAIVDVGWFDLRHAAGWGEKVLSDRYTYPELLQIQAKIFGQNEEPSL